MTDEELLKALGLTKESCISEQIVQTLHHWLEACDKIADLEKENEKLKKCCNEYEMRISQMEKGICDACKETEKDRILEELEKENAELNKKLSKAEADYDKMFWYKNEIISKAKEIIRMVIDSYKHKERFSFEKDLIKAETFLKEVAE